MSESVIYPKARSRKEIHQYIWLTLGGKVVSVNLAKCHYNEAVDKAIRWWASRKGQKRSYMQTIVANQSTYDLPEYVDSVVEVIPVEGGYAAGIGRAIDPFYEAGDGLPMGPLAAGSGFLGSYTQALIYQKDLRKVTSSDFSWEQQERELLIFNGNTISGTACRVYYLAKVLSFESLSLRDNEMVADYALAWAMKILSNIWGKYTDGFLSAQGSRSLNYSKLAEEADAMIQKLEKDIEESQKPASILWGTR